MKYSEYTDEELIDILRDGNKDIETFLLTKYKPLVLSKANNLFIIGGDKEDLIQEGMIGLSEAITNFDPGRDTSFATFGSLCITRQMLTAINSAQSKKHMPLSDYTSIYEEDFQKEGGLNPEDAFLDKERVSSIEKRLYEELSDMEKQVIDLKLAGMEYQEIAAILGKSPKSIDNTLSRIKSKLRNIINN